MDTQALEPREAYWRDPAAKSAFCDLLRDVFTIDFDPWDRAGFWDDDYRPFTLFDRAGRAVSSVCLYSMRVIVAGRSCVVGQISGVATRPEWRRRGLATRLATQALARSAEYGHAFQYLFADDHAAPLYHQLGFGPVAEYTTSIELACAHEPAPGARRCDPESADDVRLIHRLACERTPVSQQFCAMNERLVMFYALVALRDAFWRIESLDVVVVARRVDGVLKVYDVIGPRLPALAEVYRHLAHPTDRHVLLYFTPDRMGDLADLGAVVQRPFLGNNLHARGVFPLTEPVSLPITAQA